jgi:hypothetical protein
MTWHADCSVEKRCRLMAHLLEENTMTWKVALWIVALHLTTGCTIVFDLTDASF